MPMTPAIRQTLVASSAVLIAQQAYPSTQFSRSFATRARPNQSSEIKTWLANFEDDHEIVPAKILQSTLERDRLMLRARSKAPLDVLKNYVPTAMVEGLKSSRFYTKGSDSLVMQSAMARRAQFKKAECLKTFHNLLREVAKQIISEEDSYIPSQLSKMSLDKRSISKARHEYQAEQIKSQKAKTAARVEANIAREEKEKRRSRKCNEMNSRSKR